MKNTLKKVFAFLFVALAVFAFVACKKKDPVQEPTQKTPTPVPTETQPTTEPQPTVEEWDGAYIGEEEYKAYMTYDLELMYSSIAGQLAESQKAPVKDLFDQAYEDIEAAKTLAAVKAVCEKVPEDLKDLIPAADGVLTYKYVDADEKTEILGLLENYCVTCGTVGITLFEDSGYVLYGDRVTLGTETYIVGYGFGTLAEGHLNGPLDYETNADWKMYYHTFNANDPGTCNYLNDQGAEVGDFYGYFGASFYTNFMNAEKNGYDWVPELANSERPIAVNPDEHNLATTWKMEVKTGANGGLKYNTNSTDASRAAFNNRDVELEDYIYPFQLLLTQSNGLYRGSEMAKSTSGAIKGAKAYYAASAEGFNAEAWENVGVKVYEEGGKPYFEVEFVDPCSQFYAMYYISSSLYMPVPQEFVELCGVKYYLGFSEDGQLSPVDNTLSLGSYTLEKWDSNEQIVYKKNPNYVFASTKYAVEGVHIKVLEAANEDPTAGIKEFLAGHIDASGIPQDYLEQYKNDPRARQTKGTSNFKLNANTCDEETWIELFGENGSVKQYTVDKYWEVKPVLGNKHFLRALSYSIDRNTFAAKRGSTASVEYLASNYMSDPENGISYSITDAHKAAIAQLLTDTDNGYSLELAQDYFRMALSELEAAGKIQPGTKENPTVFELEIAWQRPTHEDLYHNEIIKYFMDAFNDEAVSGGKYQLKFTFWVGDVWSDVYYSKLMVGQFDLGFGSISGNSLDPLGFMEVASSDPKISGNFTLNWGVNTNDPDAYPLVFDGKRWSYDGLYKAANTTAIVSQGANSPAYTFDWTGLTRTATGYEATATFVCANSEVKVVPTDIALCNYAQYYGSGNVAAMYEEFYLDDFEGYSMEVTTDGNTVTVKVTVTNEVAEELAAHYLANVEGAAEGDDYYGYMGFDFYFDLTVGQGTSEAYESVDDFFFGE